MKDIEDFLVELNAKWPKTGHYRSDYYSTTGKRYWKICYGMGDSYIERTTQQSVYGFVDKTTGDLYKAASWRQPAKHIRGNINDPSGLDACDEYSVRGL